MVGDPRAFGFGSRPVCAVSGEGSIPDPHASRAARSAMRLPQVVATACATELASELRVSAMFSTRTLEIT